MASINLGWDASTGPDLAGYAVYYGTASGAYDFVIDVGNITSFVVVDLDEGTTYYFIVKAYDTDGLFGPASDEISGVAEASGVTIGAPSISGVGGISEAIRISAPTIAGVGTEIFTGTGSVGISVSGLSIISGEGGVAIGAPSITGAGAVTASDSSEASGTGAVTTKPLKIWPPASTSVRLLTGAADTFGDWVEIVASASAKSQLAGFFFGLKQSDSSGSGHYEIQFGVGAGVPVPIADIPIVSTGAPNLTLETQMLRVPIDLVPAGGRLCARARTEGAGSHVDLGVMYYEGLDAGIATTGYYHYLPYGTAQNLAALITPNPVAWLNNTDGWVEFGRVDDASGLLGVAVMPGSLQEFEDYEVDLALGEAGREVFVTMLPSNFGKHGFHTTWLPAIYPVDAGTRVSCRFRKSGTRTSTVRARLLYLGGLDPELPLPVITEPVFSNSTLTTGETWIILTTRSGTKYVWSDRPLPDPPGYYEGWKEPRVITWGKIRRALSGWDGQYEASNFTVMLSDTDRLLRQLHQAGELIHATAAVYMIEDADRRALLPAFTVYRGVVTGANPKPTLQFELVIKDTFQEQFAATDTSSLIPRRTITGADFANCGQEKVACSADGYLVNGAIQMASATGYAVDGNTSAGAGSVDVRNGQGTFTVGRKGCFRSHPTVYTVTSSSGTDPETAISFTPVLAQDILDGDVFLSGDTVAVLDGGVGVYAAGSKLTFSGHATTYAVSEVLADRTGIPYDPAPIVVLSSSLTANVADNETVTAVASHAVQPAVGKQVTFCYGKITDRNVMGDIDAGDGQGPARYAGDKVLPDGKRYGEFVWQGHACYSPDGKPFDMLYFWNNALDDMVAGYPALKSLADEAGAGGRIVIPGYANWNATNGYGAASYRDYNGHRYTVIYLNGIYRDWALGIAPAPVNLDGGIPFAVSGYGVETTGDGTGTLITRGLQQFKHIAKNWCPPKGAGYQSGAYLASPTFPDDPTLSMIDEESFDAADAQSEVYVPGGFGGDFIVGLEEGLAPRDLIAQCARSWGVDVGFSRKSQFFVSMLNTNLDTTPLQRSLTWVRDIFSGTWNIEANTRNLYAAIDFRHSQDYFKRVSDGWRSVLSGVTALPNDLDTSSPGAALSPTVYLPMLRGKNRDADPDYYQRGSDTAAAVLALRRSRFASVQNQPSMQTGPAGFNYALADVIPVTHYEGLGAAGYDAQPIRVERHEIDPSQYTTTLEGYDMAPVLA